MDPDELARGRSVITTLALFLASLVALRVGQFIQFDDRSGFGDADMVMPLGVLAVLLALGALVAGSKESMARRSLGGALLILDATIVAIAASDDGFRFIWTTYEGELFTFEIMLGVTGLVLLTPAFLSPSRPAGPAGDAVEVVQESPRLTAWARASIYLCLLTIAMFSAFVVGVSYYETTECSGPEGGECDMAAFGGIFWAMCTFVLGVIVIVATEVVLAVKRRSRRAAAGVR